MKNTFGNSVAVTIFGESHGEAIGVVLDGLAPGIGIDYEYINSLLEKRKGKASLSTARREKDAFRIVSGVFEGKTTGTPITVIIENDDTKSKDYSSLKDLARPGHADYTADCKYHGFQDYRGGGHFSGRITAPLVAAGAIALTALKNKGIEIGTHVLSLGGVWDRPFDDFKNDFELVEALTVPVLDDKAREDMEMEISSVRGNGDSIGGRLETAVIGLPKGLGEPWFDSIESKISHIVFSVPGVKGIEFGSGFGFAGMKGSEANDSFRVCDGEIITKTNHNGGINGGISNGMPVVFRTAVKPTPSIYKKQETVDFVKNENTDILIEGRHDPAIVHRAAVVVTSVTALCICDMLSERYGTDYFTE